MAQCPHCRKAIEPPPKRSRKCPHCQQRIEVRKGQLFTSDDADEFDAKRDAAEAKKRFREGRKQVAQAIRQGRKYGITAGFEPLVSDDACKVCLAVRGKIFPIKNCKPEMLPPYENCEFPTGCESTYQEVLDDDRRLYAKSRRRRPGCLGTLGVIILGIVAAVVMSSLRSWLNGR